MKAPARLDIDRLGAVAGFICAVHCLLTGVAIGVLSVLGVDFLGGEAAEWGFLGCALVLGLFAVRSGRRRHGSWAPGLIFASGLLFLALSHLAFGGHHNGAPSSIASTTFAVLGGLSLTAFHLLNRRLA